MAILGEDKFNRADEAPMVGWIHQETSLRYFKIASNVAVPNTVVNDISCRFPGSWSSDQWADCNLNVVGGVAGDGSGGGICLRAQVPTKTYYRIVVNAAAINNLEVARFDNGVKTSLGFRTVTWVANDTLAAAVTGTNPVTIHVLQNLVQIGADFVDSTAPLTGGSPGLIASSTMTTVIMDNWRGGSGDGPSAADDYHGEIIKPNMLRPRAFAPGLAR